MSDPTEKTPPAPKRAEPAMDAAPQLVDELAAKTFAAPTAELPTDVDPDYAGVYEITHGAICIRRFDAQKNLVSKFYRKGVRVHLSAIDGERLLALGTAKRVDGKRPDHSPRHVEGSLDKNVLATRAA